MNEDNINSMLDSIRKRYLEWSMKSLQTELDGEKFEPICIDGKNFESSVWLDPVGGEKLLIVQLEHKGAVINTTYCCGARMLGNGKFENLSNDQLWEMGIP